MGSRTLTGESKRSLVVDMESCRLLNMDNSRFSGFPNQDQEAGRDHTASDVILIQYTVYRPDPKYQITICFSKKGDPATHKISLGEISFFKVLCVTQSHCVEISHPNMIF